MGLDAFKAEVETRQGFTFQPARPFKFTSNVDEFGWVKDRQGRNHFTCFIENGRVQDEPGKDFKTGLREIAKIHKGRFRLTANQHLIISEVPDAEIPKIKELLKKYRLDNLQFSGLRLSSSACVAFPTCGLAMAESERVRRHTLISETHNSPSRNSTCPFSSIRLKRFVRRMA
jgi:sulfite reductase (NADPH) hemoprotein beta-component